MASVSRVYTRLLSFFERHTKTDLTYLTKGGFWLTLDQIGGGLIAFFLAIAFAHFVPKEVYGKYRYLLSVFWILTAFTLTGLPTALSQAVARGHEGAFRASFFPSLVAGIPFFLIACATSGYYFVNGNVLLSVAFLCISVLGPFIQPSFLFGSFLSGRKDFKTNSLFGLLLYAVPSFALFGTMLLTTNPLIFLVVYLVSNILTGVFLTILVFSFWRPNTAQEPNLRVMGGHFSAMNLLSTIAQQIDKIIVFHYLGAVQLAVYTFATALPEQIKGVVNGVSTLALPKFVTRPFSEVHANFWNRLWILTGALVLVSLAYIAAAPLAFKIFFPAYGEAVLYSQIYAISLIAIGNAIPITLLQAREAKRELYIYNIISPISQIAILVSLTATYGLMGAIVARIAGRLVSLAVGAVLLELYALRTRRNIDI